MKKPESDSPTHPTHHPATVRIEVRVTGLDGPEGTRIAGVTLSRAWRKFDVSAEQLSALKLDHRVQFRE